MQSLYKLYLKAGEDRRIKRGHPWVYSNEIDVARSPLKAVAPGTPTLLLDAAGHSLGTGFLSPNSLLCLRLLSRQTLAPETLLRPQLARALAWRQQLYAEPYYRWVYAEGDGLPGLVIDRYGDACVVQTSSHGMEQMLPQILALVEELVQPTSLVVKNDASMRALEGLPSYVQVVKGSPAALVREGQAEFAINLETGQKTGWFYDQRDNRLRLPQLFAGGRVLDLYSYLGAWSVQAALAGADSVLAVDASAGAVAGVLENAARNQVAGKVHAERADVSQWLAASQDSYDWVILDPPGLIPRRKDLKKGQDHYRQLNRLALQRVAEGGILVSCSCSALLDEAAHLSLIRAAARQARREFTLVGRGSMPPDHPIHPMLSDSAYLKCWFLRVGPAL